MQHQLFGLSVFSSDESWGCQKSWLPKNFALLCHALVSKNLRKKFKDFFQKLLLSLRALSIEKVAERSEEIELFLPARILLFPQMWQSFSNTNFHPQNLVKSIVCSGNPEFFGCSFRATALFLLDAFFSGSRSQPTRAAAEDLVNVSASFDANHRGSNWGILQKSKPIFSSNLQSKRGHKLAEKNV